MQNSFLCSIDHVAVFGRLTGPYGFMETTKVVELQTSGDGKGLSGCDIATISVSIRMEEREECGHIQCLRNSGKVSGSPSINEQHKGWRVRGVRKQDCSPFFERPAFPFAFAFPTAITLAGISPSLPSFVRSCPSGPGNRDSRMFLAHVPHERVPPAVRLDDLTARYRAPQRVVDLDDHLNAFLTGLLCMPCGPVVTLQLRQPDEAGLADVAIELGAEIRCLLFVPLSSPFCWPRRWRPSSQHSYSVGDYFICEDAILAVGGA